MSVVIETSIGDLVIDLYIDERPTCDPTGSGRGGESVFNFVYGDQARYFEMERFPIIKHRKLGTVSMINNGNDMHGSQFLITLSSNLDYLDGKHTVFGEVAKGFDVLEKLNEWICDKENRPYQDIRIFHTVILDDPFEDFAALSLENGRMSPEPTEEKLQSDRIRVDEEVDQLEGMSQEEIDKYMKEREAKTRAKLLEIIGDIPDAEIKPPENVLFVCKLNPVTTDEDLELIFSRFGKINSCEVIRDRKTGDSLCYAFIDFDRKEDCENAYFKMDNVLIDDRRIHVDFSQSVSKVNWKGKGTGTGYFIDNRNYREEKKEESKFKFNEKSRKGHGYEFVFDEENNHESKYEPMSQRGSKYHKEFEHEKVHDYKERDHRENRDFKDYKNYKDEKDKYRSSDREKYRDKYDDRDRERHRDRDRERHKDRSHSRDRHRSDKDRHRNRSSDRDRIKEKNNNRRR